MVWVSERREAVDPGWFFSDGIDLIVLLQGHLKVEFDQERFADRILPGDDLRCDAP
ncbi:MAG TPA: hypothetical protein VIT43_06185 [Candidatus Dormibacteraeota bacterium]